MSVSLRTNNQLSLSLPNAKITAQPVSSSGSHKKDDVGPIVGGVLGGLAFLLLAATAVFIFWRKRITQVPHSISVGGQQAQGGTGFFQPQSPSGLGTPSTPLLAGAAAVPPPTMSRKQREALGRSRERILMQRESAFSPHPASASATEGLRTEVERLRREMESIRYITDAPPGYA